MEARRRRRQRRERLSQRCFSTLEEARHVLETWREEYKNRRPHGRLGDRTPAEHGPGGRHVPDRNPLLNLRADGSADGFGARTDRRVRTCERHVSPAPRGHARRNTPVPFRGGTLNGDAILQQGRRACLRPAHSGLSAVIITRNEERNIGRCLASIAGVCDEAIVVDAESSDDTRSIAEAAGARVTMRAWTDYSDQKNFADSLATHDWILSLDADEELSPALRSAILDAKRQGFGGAYGMNRLTNYCGTWVRHGGWYPDTKVRLFDRKAARWEGAYVHEELKVAEGTPITLLHGDLLHYSYHTIKDHLERVERYSTLHARRLFATGHRPGPVKRWLSPPLKFLHGYLLKAGFLDGRAGYDIARLSAKAVRLKYAKLHALHHGHQA